jgi:hypothetical protein
MKIALRITIALFACTALTRAQTPKTFGGISFPAPGNIDLDEGSVELWVVNNYDSTDKKSAAGFFDIQAPPGEMWHYVLMHISWGQSIAMIGYGVPQHSYVWSGKLNWKPGERHYLVWTWSGRKRSIYIDGKTRENTPAEGPLQGEGRGNSTKDVAVEGWLRGNLTGAQLLVGLRYSPITVDEIRISSVARTEEEIAKTSRPTPRPRAIRTPSCSITATAARTRHRFPASAARGEHRFRAHIRWSTPGLAKLCNSGQNSDFQ